MKEKPTYRELEKRIADLEREALLIKESLRDHEESYRSNLDYMQEAYYEVDLKGDITFFSVPVMARLGYHDEDMLGKSFTRFVDENNAKRLFDAYHTVFTTGKPVAGLYWEAIKKNGDRLPVETSISLKYDASENPVGFMGVIRDLTRHKQAEIALIESEGRYRDILENIQEAYYEVDLKGNFTFFNFPVMMHLGYTNEEIQGMSFRCIVDPENEKKAFDAYHKVFITGKPNRGFDWEVTSKNGEKIPVEASVSLKYDAGGNLVGFKGVVRDITERKKAEEALKQSEERFRDLARLLPETVYETDEKGIIIFANEAAFEKFRYTPEDFLQGLSVQEMIIPEDREKAGRVFMSLMAGEQPGLNEYTALRKDGTTFPVLGRSTLIMRRGKPSGVRGFIIDVSDKKALEEQLMRAQKMEAIGTLAGGIAHDFNNLLMGILGNISLMLIKTDQSHPFHDRLKSIEKYVQQGSDLTKQFLGFAQGGQYEVKSTDLGDFVRKSSEMFGRTKKEIRIHRKVQDCLWPVEVDTNQMEQVMLNLFVNAWQAMPRGGDLFLSVENVEFKGKAITLPGAKPGKYVKVSVADTGIGMNEATKARIFEPFFTTKEKGRGTGLGLASVYGIVKKHRGFIIVESAEGTGSTFMIFLPASSKAVQMTSDHVDTVPEGRETLLLIDDEEMILDVGSQMLLSLGYKVIKAKGGREGVEIYSKERQGIDLVVLDMVMPDLGGSETFDMLHEIDPDLKVLLSSGYSIDGKAKEILDRGCCGFIQKPFSISDLAKKIREILIIK